MKNLSLLIISITIHYIVTIDEGYAIPSPGGLLSFFSKSSNGQSTDAENSQTSRNGRQTSTSRPSNTRRNQAQQPTSSMAGTSGSAPVADTKLKKSKNRERRSTTPPSTTSYSGDSDLDGFEDFKSKRTMQREKADAKSRPASTTSSPPIMPTKYYKLAAAWPVALNNAWDGYQSWTIHGLWPEKNNRQLQNCPTSISDFDLRDTLNNMVNTATPNNNYDSWNNAMGTPTQTRPQLIGHLEHQWKKHGSCYKENPTLRTVKEYFQKAGSLIKHLDISQTLMNKFYSPGSYKYDLEIFDLVKSAWGVKAIIQCEIGSKNSRLSEIQFCYTESWTLTDCAPYSSGSYISPKCTKISEKTNKALQVYY